MFELTMKFYYCVFNSEDICIYTHKKGSIANLNVTESQKTVSNHTFLIHYSNINSITFFR